VHNTSKSDKQSQEPFMQHNTVLTRGDRRDDRTV